MKLFDIMEIHGTKLNNYAYDIQTMKGGFKMTLGADGCGCGIAIVVVIILLLIALGIVF